MEPKQKTHWYLPHKQQKTSFGEKQSLTIHQHDQSFRIYGVELAYLEGRIVYLGKRRDSYEEETGFCNSKDRRIHQL